MVKAESLAEALEELRQGCTELKLQCACSGAPPTPAAPPLAHVCGGRVRRAAPSARRTRSTRPRRVRPVCRRE